MYIYKTGIRLIDEEKGGLPPGSNILVLVPSIGGGERLGYSIVRPLPGEYALILSTIMRAVDLVDLFSSTRIDRSRVGIIDAVSKLSTPEISDSTQIRYVSSPSDLTGIGIKFSSLVESIFNGEFGRSDEALFPPPIRFYIDSLTTLLMYRRLEVIYQFLHVIATKLKKVEAIGIYALSNESFDEKTISLIKHLMNVVIEVKNEQSMDFLKVQGIPGITQDWVQFRITETGVELSS